MLQAVKKGHAIEPSNPQFHMCAVRFLKAGWSLYLMLMVNCHFVRVLKISAIQCDFRARLESNTGALILRRPSQGTCLLVLHKFVSMFRHVHQQIEFRIVISQGNFLSP